jgi:hypothetical protein
MYNVINYKKAELIVLLTLQLKTSGGYFSLLHFKAMTLLTYRNDILLHKNKTLVTSWDFTMHMHVCKLACTL